MIRVVKVEASHAQLDNWTPPGMQSGSSFRHELRSNPPHTTFSLAGKSSCRAAGLDSDTVSRPQGRCTPLGPRLQCRTPQGWLCMWIPMDRLYCCPRLLRSRPRPNSKYPQLSSSISCKFLGYDQYHSTPPPSCKHSPGLLLKKNEGD